MPDRVMPNCVLSGAPQPHEVAAILVALALARGGRRPHSWPLAQALPSATPAGRASIGAAGPSLAPERTRGRRPVVLGLHTLSHSGRAWRLAPAAAV